MLISDDALADIYPALFSHCRQQDVSVRQVFEDGLQGSMVSRLSPVAPQQLQEVQTVIAGVNLTEDLDRRMSAFTCGQRKIGHSKLKGLSLPSRRRDGFIQSKPGNQTHYLLARLR
jgi:hypothetical protein